MRNFRFWIPTVVGILITPLCLYLTLLSTGAGHGGYGAMLVLYPLPTLILVLFAGLAPSDAFLSQGIQTVSMVLVFGIAILQFPVYGFLLGYAKLKGSCLLTVCAGIIWLHVFGIVVWLVIAGVMKIINGT